MHPMGIKCLNCGDILLWSMLTEEDSQPLEEGKECSCSNLRIWKDPFGFCLCVVIPEKMIHIN